METLSWQVAAITDRGCKRSENEDNFYISPDKRVFLVADGMGGELGGATASRLAVEAVENLWHDHTPDSFDKEAIQEWLVKAISNANRSVFDTAENDPSVRRMGTTIVIAVQSDNCHLHIAHVGDSRAYLIRDGKIILLTQDHSLVMDLLLAGKLTPEQSRTSPYRNYITRCVGHNHRVEIDQTPVALKPHDWVILCTDGLTAVLHDEQIGKIVENLDQPMQVCEELLKQTLAGGAPDNVTVIAIRYSQPSNDAIAVSGRPNSNFKST